jgi:hypothetical protein
VSTQLGLRLDPIPRDRIQETFERFDAAHPEVYALFTRAARDLVDSGRKRIGAKNIFEHIRWETRVGALASERPYKINNNFPARYVRKLLDEYPELAPFIEIRRLSMDPR